MVYVRKRYSSTVKGTLCCWQVKVILLSFLVFSHRNRFTESNLKLGCSTYVTWLLQTCHLALQFCFFKRKETEEEQTCKLSKRTEEHLVYLLKSRSSESSFHKNLMSLPLCDRLMLWLWHDVSCTSAAIGTTSAETCLGPAGHGHGGLSTYLFVCVLRRSFTSISKISFWLKLDFNLSANAVMLLKKKHHGGIMFLAFSVCFGLHMTVQCLLFGFMSSSGHFMSCTTSHPHSLCCAMVVRTLCWTLSWPCLHAMQIPPWQLMSSAFCMIHINDCSISH